MEATLQKRKPGRPFGAVTGGNLPAETQFSKSQFTRSGDAVQFQIPIIPSMLWLGEAARYKVGWGGRASGKTMNAINELIIRAMSKDTRILCARQVMETIKDSTYAVIVDQIAVLGLSPYFDITGAEIRCKINKSYFIFKGLTAAKKDKTALKAWQGIDICFLDEAEDLIEDYWNILWPTIRKNGSEIWIFFNTGTEDDFVYKYFVVNTPTNVKCLVKRLFYYNNPCLSETILQSIESCRIDEPEVYKHYWLGDPAATGSVVYPTFKREAHIHGYSYSDMEYIFENGMLFCAIDPHKVYYPAVLWGAKVQTGNNEFDYIIYNEFPLGRTMFNKLYHEYRHTSPCTYNLRQLSDVFKILDCTVQTINGDFKRKADKIIRGVDPYYATGPGGKDWSANTRGITIEWAQPENGGLFWNMPEREDVKDGMDKIKQLMLYNPNNPIDSINSPHLYIMPHCLNAIDTLQFHRYDFENLRQDEKRKCFSDTLRILIALMAKTPFMSPVIEREKKKEQLKPLMGNMGHLFFSTRRKQPK
jgi:hypothetical protein